MQLSKLYFVCVAVLSEEINKCVSNSICCIFIRITINSCRNATERLNNTFTTQTKCSYN